MQEQRKLELRYGKNLISISVETKQYTVSDPGGQRWTFAQSAKVQQK